MKDAKLGGVIRSWSSNFCRSVAQPANWVFVSFDV